MLRPERYDKLFSLWKYLCFALCFYLRIFNAIQPCWTHSNSYFLLATNPRRPGGFHGSVDCGGFCACKLARLANYPKIEICVYVYGETRAVCVCVVCKIEVAKKSNHDSILESLVDDCELVNASLLIRLSQKARFVRLKNGRTVEIDHWTTQQRAV